MLSISVPSRSKRIARGALSTERVRGYCSSLNCCLSQGKGAPRCAPTMPPSILCLLQEILEALGAGGVAELAERLRLDLADALARDAELPAHLFERHRVAVVQAK